MNENLTLLIDAFCRRYDPVGSIEESTDLLEPRDVMLMFDGATLLPPEEIIKALGGAGFKLELVDLKFVWLVKEKAG